MVEGGNQRKSECTQIMSWPVSAAHGPPRSQPAQPERSPLSGQQRTGGHVPLPLALFQLAGWAVTSREPPLCCQLVLRDGET